MAKLQLRYDAVPTFFCHVEESGAQAVSSILSVPYLCQFCVGIKQKGVVRTAECIGAHGGGNGGG